MVAPVTPRCPRGREDSMSREKERFLPAAGEGPAEDLPLPPNQEGKYPCPCCGNLTFPVPKGEAAAYICPVCFWENDVFTPGEEDKSDENRGMTLKQGRENYRRWGAVREELVRCARPPEEKERPMGKETIGMKRLLLTSAGFENPVVLKAFIELLGKEPRKAGALFIPTAAIDEDARAVLPKCRGDLLNAGFPEENITVYDLDRPMTEEELSRYDAVYFCGGSTEYLLERVRASGFAEVLDRALEKGLLYVGVSAGSIIAAQNLPGNLGYLPRRLEVHCEKGSPQGPLPQGTVCLTNAQAVKIVGGKREIIG